MEEKKDKLPISAIVVGFNEEDLIRDCFSSINFCDEIIFVDLGSTDSTIDIAKEFTANIYSHERVPIVEIIHHEFIGKLKHDWLLIPDPDERFNQSLVTEIRELFAKGIPNDIGGYVIPWIFYFKNRRLNGTVWGGIKSKTSLLHKNRYNFLPIVHRGRNVLEGYRDGYIEYKGENYITHLWMNSYSQLLEKHWRYIKIEPKSRYTRNIRTGLKGILTAPFRAFKSCYLDYKGYKDGLRGIFLSLFWSWYETCCLIGLYLYQKKHDK
ncbi:glycosyltransferase [Dysgonomonas sp. 511]|uniref:glycosyltransferase n=1 Tax=Dysgonomonas sp. 511 TaxID=2302930 RepID=UPI0013D5ED96|nr:glycosyltransferase [Dysgonomonas sp. 511]NDV78809.1 glycosyltransferase [Dysgonomonas sp. 511]